MDIISMQVANKALKKLNTEYGGFCYTYTATDGQVDIISQKSFDKEGYTLKVHVDGIRAIKDKDYTLIDNKTVRFVEPLRAGDVVTLSTDIAGVPKYTIMYDDTEIKEDASNIKGDIVTINEKIVTIGQEIEDIKSALDEDGDGSIVDTIAEIKKQWQSADEGLKALIEGKAETDDVNAIKLSLDDITNKLTKAAEDIIAVKLSIEDKASTEQVGVIASELEAQAEVVNTTKTKVEIVEKKGLSDFIIKDDYTGRRYSLSLNNGSLTPVLNHEVMTAAPTIPEKYIVNEPQEFTIDITGNQDAGIMIKAYFTIPAGAIIEYFEVEDGQWYRLEDFFGPTVTGFPVMDITTKFRATFTADGDYSVKVKFNRVDNNYTLKELDLNFIAENKDIEVGGTE